MRVVFKLASSVGVLVRECCGTSGLRVVPHHGPDCEQNTAGNMLATAFSLRTIINVKTTKNLRKQA
jgi:hypothetical protein